MHLASQSSETMWFWTMSHNVGLVVARYYKISSNKSFPIIRLNTFILSIVISRPLIWPQPLMPCWYCDCFYHGLDYDLATKIHDDAINWKHFPRYWPFVTGIHRSPVDSPHKGQWRRAVMFSLIYVWTNGCANNRDAGDLRRPSCPLWRHCNDLWDFECNVTF